MLRYSSRCRGRMVGGEEDPRFAGYPRFRGSGRHHPSAFAGASGAPLLHAAHAGLAAHARAPPDDDALYETADAERLRDAPDSERWVRFHLPNGCVDWLQLSCLYSGKFDSIRFSPSGGSPQLRPEPRSMPFWAPSDPLLNFVNRLRVFSFTYPLLWWWQRGQLQDVLHKKNRMTSAKLWRRKLVAVSSKLYFF